MPVVGKACLFALPTSLVECSCSLTGSQSVVVLVNQKNKAMWEASSPVTASSVFRTADSVEPLVLSLRGY